MRGWVAKGRGVVGHRWRRLRGWRPDVRGWPWHARWAWHRAVGRWAGWSLLVIGAIVIGAVVAVVLEEPDWLIGTGSSKESGSTTIRNVGLIGGGAIAILIAYWRSRLAQQDLLNKRYQESSEMLGSEVLAVRLAGIYALERLAKEHPWEYHIEVMKSLCAFVRNPAKDDDLSRMLEEKRLAETTPTGGTPRYEPRQDVQAAMEAICACHRRQLRLETKAGYKLDLTFSDLRGIDLVNPDLTGARLAGVDLREAILRRPNFSGAWLVSLRGRSTLGLSGMHLGGANFTDAYLLFVDLTETNLSGAIMTGTVLNAATLTRTRFATRHGAAAIGLIQHQLDWARADPNKPPYLEKMRDADTGKRLVWRGQTLDGKPHPNPPPIPDA